MRYSLCTAATRASDGSVMKLWRSVLPVVTVSELALTSTAVRAQGLESAPMGAPFVHIEAGEPGILLCRVPSPYDRVPVPVARPLVDCGIPVCRAPCDGVVPHAVGERFRFGGRYLPPSRKVSLDGLSGNVSFEVKAGSSLGRGMGLALLSLGGIATGAGVVILPVATGPQGADTRPFLAAAATSIAIGFGLAMGGLALYLTSGTSVKFKQLPIPLGRSAQIQSGVLRF